MSQKFPCPCCSYLTYAEAPSGNYDICPVCFWEDEPLSLGDENYAGGANGVSLIEARKNFLQFGACEAEMVKHVRKPLPEEYPAMI